MVRFPWVRGLLVVAACAMTSSVALAQLKVGIISVQKAVLDTAEIKKAQAEMEARYRPRQMQMEKLQKELQSVQQQLQAGAGKLTAAAEQDLNAQATRKQKELQRLGEDLQADVDRDRNEILGRAGQRMQEVVRKLAETKGLDVVVEAASTIYFKTALDLTADATVAYDTAYPAK